MTCFNRRGMKTCCNVGVGTSKSIGILQISGWCSSSLIRPNHLNSSIQIILSSVQKVPKKTTTFGAIDEIPRESCDIQVN